MSPAEPHAHADQRAWVLPETTTLAILGCLDLLTTVYLIASGQAREANPFMADLLQTFGPGGLILGKVLLLAGPLTVAELARRRNPAFVRAALRVGILAYLTLYVVGFSRLNGGG